MGGQRAVPLYQGGAVRNAVRAAKFRVEAGQADLRATEASIFAQVVGAYMDVIRDQAIVQLNQKNVSVLRTNLQATSDRFEIGDLPRTGVAPSEEIGRATCGESGCRDVAYSEVAVVYRKNKQYKNKRK